MSAHPKFKNFIIALTGAVLAGSLAWAVPAEAGYQGGYRDVVVYRHVVQRPVVRRVVIVERPYYPRVRYSYGWHHRVGYRPGWRHRRWHDRPRCWLPERHLCR
jgi:hypothetical protein